MTVRDNPIHPAYPIVQATLLETCPDEWEIVAPYVNQLFHALDEGHTYITITESEQSTLLNASTIVQPAPAFCPLLIENNQLFLGRLWQLEYDIAHELYRIAHAPSNLPNYHIAQNCLAQWFPDTSSQHQKAAVALALYQPFMLINGGPGTGKTTTVAKLLALICQSIYDNQQLPEIVLAAPTGKAAKHMLDALHHALKQFTIPDNIRAHLTHIHSYTVHRLLKMTPPLMDSHFNHRHPLSADIVVIDESSMLDLSLLKKLLTALKTGCRLILLGDSNQLPAVGNGDLLGSLTQNTVLSPQTASQIHNIFPLHGFPVSDHPPALGENIATLLTSYRFSADSAIGHLAHAVIQENIQAAQAAFEQFPQYLSCHEYTEPQCWNTLYQKQYNYWQAIQKQNIEEAFVALTNIMVLAAWRQTVDQFNQGYLNYLKQQGHQTDDTWFSGKIIIITQNDYSTQLFNGDIGIVLRHHDEFQVYFQSGNEIIHIHPNRIPAHNLAFAITIHKSQGSEYQEVWLLPTPEEPSTQILDKQMLYTAITRARHNFTYFGNLESFQAACINKSPRRTHLRQALFNVYQQPPYILYESTNDKNMENRL